MTCSSSQVSPTISEYVVPICTEYKIAVEIIMCYGLSVSLPSVVRHHCDMIGCHCRAVVRGQISLLSVITVIGCDITANVFISPHTRRKGEGSQKYLMLPQMGLTLSQKCLMLHQHITPKPYQFTACIVLRYP